MDTVHIGKPSNEDRVVPSVLMRWRFYTIVTQSVFPQWNARGRTDSMPQSIEWSGVAGLTPNSFVHPMGWDWWVRACDADWDPVGILVFSS